MACLNVSRSPLRYQHLDVQSPELIPGLRKDVADLIRASAACNPHDIRLCRVRLRQRSFDVVVKGHPDSRRADEAGAKFEAMDRALRGRDHARAWYLRAELRTEFGLNVLILAAADRRGR